MKKRFKKIYLEITNNCNLACTFCIKNNRVKKYISIDEFNYILKQLAPYTDYLYFHLLGEPLLHPDINELINTASKNFKVNITTNGYLINRIKNNKNIRQLNISLHSFEEKYHISLDTYMNNIFDVIDCMPNTYISLRLWVKGQYNDAIINYINKRYKINLDSNIDNIKINDHIFINNFHEFIWPDLSNNTYDENGTCFGLIDHMGILVDGTIVPCCLDSRGVINLGNIYHDNLKDILSGERVLNMIKNFKCNKKIEELCKHCKFIER